jgi:hypothetical protein
MPLEKAHLPASVLSIAPRGGRMKPGAELMSAFGSKADMARVIKFGGTTSKIHIGIQCDAWQEWDTTSY